MVYHADFEYLVNKMLCTGTFVDIQLAIMKTVLEANRTWWYYGFRLQFSLIKSDIVGHRAENVSSSGPLSGTVKSL